MLKKQNHRIAVSTPYHVVYWVGEEEALLETHDHYEQETTGGKNDCIASVAYYAI